MGDAAAQKRKKLHVEVPPGQPIIIMKREFDFPRDFVWDVYTDGSHMKNWWGPRIYDTVVHQFDFRNGGKWRVDNVSKDGKEVHPFQGEFSRIKPKDEFTWTFGYADFPPGTETYRFLDIGNGRTRIESVSHFPDVASRDGMVASGMEEGAIDTYDRLDELLSKLSPKFDVKTSPVTSPVTSKAGK